MKSPTKLSIVEESLKIYCDLDGVLTDFSKQGSKYIPGFKDFDTEYEYMFKTIEEVGPTFWSTMDFMSGAENLLKLISNHPVFILSAFPSIAPDKAAKGKREWIKKNLGVEWLNRTFLCYSEEKQEHAAPNAILIDDIEKNVQAWVAAGGIGVLYTGWESTKDEIQRNLS